MRYNNHSNLESTHAFLGASQYSWLNYDDSKLIERWHNYKAAQKGTELHEFASFCISLGQKLPRSQKTLNMYVNDAIGFRMQPEQILYYSENAYGTADSISFRNMELRIHDLKTGVTPTSVKQTLIYAALFCLEYRVNPYELKFVELRIYQNDEIVSVNPTGAEIQEVMDKIIRFDKLIKEENRKEIGSL